MIGLLAGVALAATLEGRVITEFGDPVPGVVVAAYNGGLRQVGVDGPTGADGRYRVEVPTGRVRLRVVPGSSVDRVEAWVPGDTRDLCEATAWTVAEDDFVEVADVVLRPGFSVTGVLRAPDGSPLAGAELEARPRRGGLDLQARRALSRSDGTFTLVGLPPDVPWVIRVEADDLPTQYLGGTYGLTSATEVSGAEQTRATLDPAVLLPGITVSGTASGPDGPLAEASVSAFSSGQVVNGRTDADGRFTLAGLPPGEITGWVDAPGHGRVYWGDTVTPGPRLPVPDEGTVVEDFDLTAPREAVVEGRLSGVDTLEGINVLWVHESGTVGLGAVTDADGTFTLERVPPGTWRLQVRGEEQGIVTGVIGGEQDPVWWTVEAGERLEVEAEVQPAVTFEGVVTGPDGEPAADALVTLRSRSTDTRWETFVLSDGSYLIGGLPGGDTWDLWAEGEPPCARDPDRVRLYHRDTPDVLARVGVARDGGDRVTWDVSLPDDRDGDAMDDAWEGAHGLIVGVDDSREDPDGDGLVNLIEYWEGRDPQVPESQGCTATPTRMAGLAGVVALLAVAGRRRRRLG